MLFHLTKFKEGFMIELLVAGLIGLAVGVGSTLGIGALKQKNTQPIIIKDERKDIQIEKETVKQLTNLDITLNLCKDEKNSGLCRELICYQFSTQKGNASQGQCESISNINNKVVLFEFCKNQKEDFDKCIDIFWRRN
jgi:hypothetical protein